MINIRYHIVSITAVFLALGIGTALGSTFLDSSTVGLLDRNIRSAENRIRDTNAANDRLQDRLDAAEARDEALIQSGSTELLADHLTDVPVLIVAAPGVDAQRVADLRIAVDRAGAELRGTLELRPDLALDEGLDDETAAALDLSEADDGDARRAVFGELTDALVAAGAPVVAEEPGEDPDGTTTTTVPGETTTTVPGETTTTVPGETTTVPEETTTTTVAPDGSTTTVPGEDVGEGGDPEGGSDEEPGLDGEQPEIITALLAGGYLNLVPGPGRDAEDPILEVEGYRYVYVSGPDLEDAANDLVLDLLPDDESVPAVVVSASVLPTADEEVPAPSAVARVRASAALSSRYSTVDNVETFSGLVATVFALEQIDGGVPGQYGDGEGALAILPPPS